MPGAILGTGEGLQHEQKELSLFSGNFHVTTNRRKNKHIIGQVMIGIVEKVRHCDRSWPGRPLRDSLENS